MDSHMITKRELALWVVISFVFGSMIGGMVTAGVERGAFSYLLMRENEKTNIMMDHLIKKQKEEDSKNAAQQSAR